MRGLHYLHVHQIVHRDIKRPNILYDQIRDRYRLCDYGSAVICKNVRLSLGGGTSEYKSPERKSPNFTGHSFPCDIFSLGKCLFEVYKGNNFQSLTWLKKVCILISIFVTHPY